MVEPYAWDVINSHVSGGFAVRGNLAIGDYQQIPTICGSSISGATLINVPIQPNWTLIGDPGDSGNQDIECAGNRFTGRLVIRDSSIFGIDLEHNTINGTVSLDHATVDLSGNTVHGAAFCRSTTLSMVVGFEYDIDSQPNTVSGENTCLAGQ